MKKIKSLLFLIILITLYSYNTNACTSFCFSYNGKHFFGKNYDWVTGNGIVCTNLKGLQKISVPQKDGKTITWVSKYGSITFNQYGKEFPSGGLNEKGLVIELMWLDDTQYAKQDNRASINELQWIQYQLDNHSTIDEVINSDKFLRITSNGAPLHFLIADASGHSATIEFLNGKLKTHSSNELPFSVLTNNTYEKSINTIKTTPNSIEETPTFKSYSYSRFTKVCASFKELNEAKKMNPINYAFNILNNVKQNNFTKWSIVYNISDKKVYFKSASSQHIKELHLTDINFKCDSQPLFYDINNTSNTRNIIIELLYLSKTAHKKTLQKSVIESRRKINLSQDFIHRRVKYVSMITCH